MRILKSSAVSAEVFKERCSNLIEDFRKFLSSDSDLLFPVGEEGNLELILEINRRSSVGVGSTSPLFAMKQVVELLLLLKYLLSLLLDLIRLGNHLTLHRVTEPTLTPLYSGKARKYIPCLSSVEVLLTTRTFQ